MTRLALASILALGLLACGSETAYVTLVFELDGVADADASAIDELVVTEFVCPE